MFFWCEEVPAQGAGTRRNTTQHACISHVCNPEALQVLSTATVASLHAFPDFGFYWIVTRPEKVSISTKKNSQLCRYRDHGLGLVFSLLKMRQGDVPVFGYAKEKMCNAVVTQAGVNDIKERSYVNKAKIGYADQFLPNKGSWLSMSFFQIMEKEKWLNMI